MADAQRQQGPDNDVVRFGRGNGNKGRGVAMHEDACIPCTNNAY